MLKLLDYNLNVPTDFFWKELLRDKGFTVGSKLQDRKSWEGYRSGHMMYLRKDDLKMANNHIREFIKKSITTSR